MTKTAKDLVVGDKIKAGSIIADVKSIRLEVPGNDSTHTVKHFTFDGQPEIAAWNLQKYIDQGSIEIL